MFTDKKTGFYSSKLDLNIEQAKNGDHSSIPWIFCVFSENSDLHKRKAAQILYEVLQKLSFDDLSRIDLCMRETTSMEWSIEWRNYNVNDFMTKQMSMEERYAILVFASFNPNGYIRQRAVQALSNYKDALTCILLRCNDWVFQVRDSAIQALTERLKYANEEEIITALPVMDKLRRSVRCEYDKIRAIMINAFKINPSLFQKGLRSGDMRARRFCINNLEEFPELKNEYLQKHIQYEKDPFLRRVIFQMLLHSDLNLIELANQFLKDKYPSNRVLALQFLYDKRVADIYDIAKKLLLDKNAQVRIMARSILAQSENCLDIYQYYIDHLSDNTAVVLYAIGEIGTKKDCDMVESYLHDNRNIIVYAAMTTLMRLNPAVYATRMTEMLRSDSAGIVKRAALLLRKSGSYDFERVYEILVASNNEDTKMKCASLLFLETKWKKLIYILLLTGSDYENLENLCYMQLIRWIIYYNRSFSVASEKEKKRINELLEEKKQYLKPNDVKQIRFLAR